MSAAPARAVPVPGVALMVGATFVFAVQDALSRHLAEAYPLLMVVMIRYWFFAAFVIGLAARRPGGLRAAARTAQPGLQILRGVLLVAEVCVMVLGFVLLGLVESHAVFAAYPLLIAALSGPLLGERVGWRQWSAIAVGFAGILVILQPGAGMVQPAAGVPLLAAGMFALYSLLTRFAARRDGPTTSFFWTGIAGAVGITAAGLRTWEPMAAADLPWMGLLCLTGVLGHWLLIRCYDVAEAGSVQPFAYFHLVFGAGTGIVVFGERLEPNVALGAAIVVGAGLFTLWRRRQRRALSGP